MLLIDEYDYQLVSNISNEELYKQFQVELQNIYNNLKDKFAIKFLLITGVTRTKNSSAFSGTDINDITNYSPYSQMMGFTREEIKKYYIDYLKLAASYENNCSVDDVTDDKLESMLDKLEEQYGGYCFDEFYKKKVFNTWSVNSFFQSVMSNKKVEFCEYWDEDEVLPSVLVNYLKTHDLSVFENLDKDKIFKVTDYDFKFPPALTTINPKVLMCQTGYLTLRSSLSDSNIVALGIPNAEIYKALNKLLATNSLKK